MSRYAAGRRAEWRARDILKRAGYALVTRSAGSKGLADLIAAGAKGILYVQVKRTQSGRWRDDNWRKLVMIERHNGLPPCAHVVAFVFTAGKRAPELIWGHREGEL